MAKTPISDEELQLKKRARRRLVGAVVLVLLVVVLVPMFLDRTPRLQKQDIDIKIPPVPGQSDAPAGAAPPSGAAPADSASPPPATATPSPPSPVAETPAPKPPAPPQPAVAPTAHDTEAAPADAKHAEAKSTGEEGYVIQVGAFSNAANAKNLLQKLKAEKIPAYSELIGSPSAGKTRVRVGPYPSMQAAEKGRERLKAVKLLPSGEAKIVRKGE